MSSGGLRQMLQAVAQWWARPRVRAVYLQCLFWVAMAQLVVLVALMALAFWRVNRP